MAMQLRLRRAGGMETFIMKNPIRDLPLTEIMRPEIALTLQHVLRIYTVGSLLDAWRNPKSQRSIEQVFESPQQARHAVATCATWLGVQWDGMQRAGVGGWWTDDRAGEALA
jgi:hypothetical protein